MAASGDSEQKRSPEPSGSPADRTQTLIRPAPRPSILHRVRNNFLTGLVLVAPIFITAYLAWAFVNLVDDTVFPLIPARYHPENVFGVEIPGLGLIVFILFTTMIGAFATNLVGRTLINWGERILHRMPVVRTVYNAIKQIAETALNRSNSSFRQACLIEYPRRGLWAVAFISTETGGEINRKIPESGQMLSVFLPTTPNPTSGFLLFVPAKDVIFLDMSVEEAAKLVISAGLVDPEEAARRRARETGSGAASPDDGDAAEGSATSSI